MTKPNGLHHLAISTGDIKRQIEFFSDVLGMELVALYWMHGVQGAWHKRARPIVMTTLAMGAGMLPIAIGWGADPSFRAPMAIAVIGGLITSTLLSLLVVPAVFTFVDDLERGLGWLTRRLRRQAPVVSEPLPPGAP